MLENVIIYYNSIYILKRAEVNGGNNPSPKGIRAYPTPGESAIIESPVGLQECSGTGPEYAQPVSIVESLSHFLIEPARRSTTAANFDALTPVCYQQTNLTCYSRSSETTPRG